jgi:hypothetical protein
MLNYLETLPMWTQLIIIMGGLIVLTAIIGAILYRLVKYGLKIKAGPIEIDATDETGDKK